MTQKKLAAYGSTGRTVRRAAVAALFPRIAAALAAKHGGAA